MTQGGQKYWSNRLDSTRIVCVVVDSTNRKSICDTGRAEKLVESTRFDSNRLSCSRPDLEEVDLGHRKGRIMVRPNREGRKACTGERKYYINLPRS